MALYRYKAVMGFIKLSRKDFRNISFQYNRSSRPILTFGKRPEIEVDNSLFEVDNSFVVNRQAKKLLKRFCHHL